ncbi:hypothetical protein [Paenibacillus flagellatus]|uniref:Uncharacterized protein n=1 Tax=Paenibacillus flagellatus TaxID=2211139 RepID=A0A2V5KFS6_9BACL|nr:hypothetical protein [Paenibacillus flagellatus]PYI57023.1 hypothetical protein DLM86_00820 [Paenibacillus flagellatus]
MKKQTESAEPTYSKEQVLASKQFTVQEKDILRALLQDGTPYTLEKARAVVKEFLNKEAR